MAKQNKSPAKCSGKDTYKHGVPQCLVQRNLVPIKTAEQFVPTPAEAVRMRYKMGGGC